MDLAILMGTNYISQHLKWIKTFHQSYTWILNTTCSCLKTTLINFFLIHFKCWLLHIKLQKFYKRNTNSINIWAYSTARACKSMVEKDLLEEKNVLFYFFKGILHPKMKILSSFTQPQVYFFCWTQKEYILENYWNFYWLPYYVFLWKSMVPNTCLVPIVLQNIFLCVQQKKETWERVNDGRIFIFGWRFPLKPKEVWLMKAGQSITYCRLHAYKVACNA